MAGAQREDRRDLWLPALVIALGWALSLAGWGSLIADRRHATLESADELAAETRELVGARFRAYTTALDELTRLWEVLGRRPLDEWQADIDLLLQNFPALAYVAWSDPADGFQRLRASPDLAYRVAEPGVLPALRRPVLLGPENDPNGRPSFRLRLPVGPGGADGQLESRVDLQRLLEGALHGKAAGYAIRIHWNERELHARGAASDDLWQQWWRVEGELELPHGVVWRVAHHPTPELAASVLTPIPHYLLASGLVLSVVLAALTRQLRLTSRQSRFLAVSNRALEDRKGELEGHVAERTEALEEAVSELRVLNQTISHDLRSPLGAVLNFASILEEDYRERPLDDEGIELLGRIQRSATRATRLLDGLQHLSRAGRARLEIEPIDMDPLVREIFVQVSVAEDEDVELIVEDLPDVCADRTLVGDVLANLFTNALKYSRGCEKRRVTVRGSVDDGRCVFEVADTGRGFDMRFEKKLFKMFERLDRGDDAGGTGIGLAIVERIVKRHGGRVWAEGEPGQGARFYFELPQGAP